MFYEGNNIIFYIIENFLVIFQKLVWGIFFEGFLEEIKFLFIGEFDIFKNKFFIIYFWGFFSVFGL